MFVTYSPEDGESREYEVDLKRIKASRAVMLEKRFGDTWDTFRVAIFKGGITAKRVLLWHILSMEHPTIRFDDVDFALNELEVEFSRGELEAMRANVLDGKMTETKAEFLKGLDEKIQTARWGEREGKARSREEPKDTSSR